ncbi:MAG: hypothetical protein WAU23_09255 [Ferruginibacter sp.]
MNESALSLDNCNFEISTTSFFTNEDSGEYKIVIGNNSASNTFPVSWDKFKKADRKYSYTIRNEQLLVLAIRNMIRKSNFNELNDALEEGEITDDEYNYQLDSYTDKYAITLKKLDNQSDINNIMDLSLKISHNIKEFTLSEVSELFSVKENDLLQTINPQLPTLV